MPVETHSVDFAASTTTNVLHLKVTGRLTKEDYARFVPELEAWIERHGRIRILFEMVDFHGWTLSAGWEDTKLAFRHFSDMERIALVGEKGWGHGMAIFCKPFTAAKVQDFDNSKRDEATDWIVA